MLINKESYREFTQDRLIFMGLEDIRPATPEDEKPKEAEVPVGEKTKDRNPLIEGKREETERYIGIIMAAVPTPYKAAYQKIADKLKVDTRQRFDQIAREYNSQLEGLGEIEFNKTIRARYEEQADNVLKKVKARLDTGYAKYAEHQAQQDRIDSARARSKTAKTPKEKAAAEADIRTAKEEIMFDYLKTAEDTRDMSDAMKRMLARFIVKGNLVDLEFGDIDSSTYNNNVDAYFRNVDRYHERIGSALKGKVEKVVKMFLDEAPNPDAQPQEITLFKRWIKEDTGLRSLFGDPDNAGSLAAKVPTILAKRFDVRFNKKGEVAYGTDLMARPKLLTHGPDELKAAVTTALKGDDFLSREKIESYEKQVDEGNEWLRKARKKIDEGVTLFRTGEITEWDDWADHTEAETLMRHNEAIRTRAHQIEGQRGARRREAREATQRKAKMDEFNERVSSSGLSKAIQRALDKGYKTTHEELPKEKGPYEALQILENEKTNDRIVIKIDEKGAITITVSPAGRKAPEAGKPERQYSVEHHFTTDDFKGTDLSELAVQARTNLEANSEKVADIHAKIAKIRKPKGLSIEFNPEPNYSKMAEAGYKIPDPVLKVGDHAVGSLVFLSKTEGKPDQVTIRINGQKDETIPLTRLNTKLPLRMNKMRQVEKHAEENKKACEEQVAAEVSDEALAGELKLPEGLEFRRKPKLEGDFANDEALIPAGDLIRKADGKVLTTLNIQAGVKPGESKRKYVATVEGKTLEEHVAEFFKKIRENAPLLLKMDEEGAEKIELTDAQKRAKETLRKIVMEKFGEKLKIDPNDKRFDRALNILASGLTDQEAAQVEKGETLTKIGTQKILDAFAKAYGYEDLGEVDPNEVRAISEMPVTVNGKKMKFREAFGEGLAQSLSRSHEFRAGKGGRLEVKEGDRFVAVTEERMASLVPASLRPGYESVVSGQTKPAEFQKEANAEAQAQEVFQKVGDLMRDPEKVEKALGKMNLGELLASIGELWRLFQIALKTGDTQSLMDGLADLQSGQPIMQKIERAKQAYSDVINGNPEKGEEGIQDTGKLIDFYNDPYGPAANEYFGPDKPFGADKVAQPYRIQLKETIQQKFAEDLGVDISEMKTISKTRTEITCSKGADRYVINLERKGGKTFARAEKVESHEDGSPYKVPMTLPGNGEVKNIKSGDKNLALVLFNAQEAPTAGEGDEGASEESETAEPPQGVKSDYFEMKDGKMVLTEKVAKPQIQDILEADVEEITLQHGNEPPVTATRRDGTFKDSNGQRLKIFPGDIVISTGLKKTEETT